jgi:hypothetical protein
MMTPKIFAMMTLGLALWTQSVPAGTCPDPATTSLQWGEVPAPWVVDPFSANTPQGDEDTRFVRANIMVAGLGRGVVCTYRNSQGNYSIWRQVLVKIPSRLDYNWINTLGGFVCAVSFSECQFSTAE